MKTCSNRLQYLKPNSITIPNMNLATQNSGDKYDFWAILCSLTAYFWHFAQYKHDTNSVSTGSSADHDNALEFNSKQDASGGPNKVPI